MGIASLNMIIINGSKAKLHALREGAKILLNGKSTQAVYVNVTMASNLLDKKYECFCC
jgi:hypothetical protein